MNKKTSLLLRNLSLFTFIAIYIFIATFLIFLESFVWETQWNVITTLIPFFLMGVVLDYIVSRSQDLQMSYKVFAQLLPASIFLLFGLSVMLEIAERPPVDAFNYLIWIFVALPFFITSNFRNDYRRRMVCSLIGTGLVGAIYIHLTTLTNELDKENGLLVYLICLFLIFYAASRINKLFFIGLILGLMDAAVLIFLWKNPTTDMAKIYGWDYNIAFQFEMLLLSNFIICILICLIAVIIQEKKSKTA